MLSTGQPPRKMGCVACGPHYPHSPEAVEGVITHLIPLLLLVCTSWKPGLWGSREDAEEDSVLQEMFTHPRAEPESDGPNQTFPL